MSILTAATLGLALAWLPPSGPRTAAAAVFPAQVQAGAWTPVGPAPTTAGVSGYSEDASGRLTGIAAHPSDPQTIVVATAGGGVWKTADGGATWKPLTDGQPVLFAGAVAIARSDPSVIYAGTGEANMGPSKVDRHNIYYGRGVLRSGDGGATWSLTGAIPFDRRTISRLVVDPQDANTVYAAVGAVAVNGVAGNTGIWKTVDGGASWTNTTTAISSTAAFADLVADPRDRNILYAAVGQPDGGDVDGINRNGVYRTTDGGASWASLDFPSTAITGRVALAISRSNPAVLYSASARTTDQHFEQAASFDLATSAWTSLGDPGSICPSGTGSVNVLGKAGDYHLVLAVDPDPARSAFVYLGGICLIRSQDGGATWSEVVASGDTSGPHRDHHALDFDAQGRLLNGNDGGIWRLGQPVPATWQNLNGNLQVTQLIGLALHPSNRALAYGGTQDTGTVRYEGAPQWPRLLRGDGGANAAVVLADGRTRVYQVTRLSSTGPIFRRSDSGGDSFAVADAGINRADPMNFYPPIALDPANPDHVLLATNHVYETSSAGVAWSPLPVTGWAISDPVDSLALAVPATTIYAGAGPHVMVSADGGQTWSQRDPTGVNGRITALAADPASSSTVYATSDGFDAARVLRSTDGGLTWVDISSTLAPGAPVRSMALDNRTLPVNVYIGTDLGVYMTQDLGSTWTRAGTGLPNAQVADLRLNTTTRVLAAATHGRGVWLLDV